MAVKFSYRWFKSVPALLMGATIAAAPALAAAPICQLGNGIEHVVYVEFDNVHFTRDNPKVPSDLEQMPNLLNFLKNNGTLDAGDHAVLISHTANDILTTQTGLYSDDDGIAVANSFGVFDPIGVAFSSSFFYWTDTVADITPATADNAFALTTPAGKNVPAPWVVFTRAGCDVGAYSTANIVLERAPFDVQQVFGAGSPQAMETTANQTNDFIGEAIHCAQGSSFCTLADGAVADLLPDEPGSYTGYQALFGSKYVSPALGGLQDINGNPLTGFPGFDPTAAQTLGVVATMLEKGVPVVFAYIADAHDNQEGASLSSEATFGPGEAPYVKQLADYNAAFGKFFERLADDGITPSNTLFVFTPDEGDHFVGSAPTNPGCDGINTPCTYSHVGELDINLNALVANTGNSTTFSEHSDDAPTIYVKGQPTRTDASVRTLERVMDGLTAVNPITGNTDKLLAAMADPIEEKLLHMVTTADPARTPTFTFFGDADYFFQNSGPATPVEGTGFAWNHGDIQPEIARTFIGIVGPGVHSLGVTKPTDFFTDHVDVRPTIMELTGLTDDYSHDGRVIVEMLKTSALPSAIRSHRATALRLGQALKQIDAPFGALAQSSLRLSTKALTSSSTSDLTYNLIESLIGSWTTRRDSIAANIKSELEGAEFGGDPINEARAAALILRAQLLIAEAQLWANML
jgi:hypothetical protein